MKKFTLLILCYLLFGPLACGVKLDPLPPIRKDIKLPPQKPKTLKAVQDNTNTNKNGFTK